MNICLFVGHLYITHDYVEVLEIWHLANGFLLNSHVSFEAREHLSFWNIR